MKNTIKFMLGIALTAGGACEEVPEFNESAATPVVQAYLYVGEPVDDVRLTELVPFFSEEEDVPVIAESDIAILANGSRYPLSPVPDAAGRYYYLGEDLSIESEQSYQLELTYRGERVTAATTVPPAPQGVTISQDDIVVPQILTRQDLRLIRDQFTQTIDITWDNNAGDYYYVLVENLEASPEAIDVNESLPRQFSFVSQPTQNSVFPLRLFQHYQQYGRHRVRLYRVNEEYANLYESLEQDSRNLNEPFSNVRNGLGIFTGFAYEEVYFEVKKP